MAFVNIPPSVIPGIKDIGLLKAKQFDKVINSLRKQEKGATIDDVRSGLDDFLDEEISETISEAIYSFGYLLARNQNSDGFLAENLSKAFLRKTEDDEVSQNLGSVIEDRLRDILVLSDFLIPTYEAYRAVYDGNSIVRNTEISTEIILLNDKSYTLPSTGVVMNRLNLSIYEDDGERKATLVLDTTDLENLRDQIDVALRETNEMKRSYNNFVKFITL